MCGIAVAFALLSPAVGRAEPFDRHLNEILRVTQTGIVRIEVRRPWTSYTLDPVPPGAAAPSRRIQGNGVVWDDQGHIVTAADLAQPGDTLIVHGAGGRRAAADYVGQDQELGVSLIRLREEMDLVALARGASLAFGEGGWVFTVGFGDDAGARLGLARATGHSSRRSPRARIDDAGDPSMAGGAVLDGEGRWIGLLLGEGKESLLLSGAGRRRPVEYCIGSSRSSRAGWVLPIDQAAATLEALAAGKTGREGFLGVRADMSDASNAGGRGVAIAEVVAGSPAYRAGIVPRDRIIAFDGTPVDGWDRLTEQVSRATPGRSVPVVILHEGKEGVVQLEIADRGHMIWRERQRKMAGGRERMLQNQIEGLRHQLELLRHQLAAFR